MKQRHQLEILELQSQFSDGLMDSDPHEMDFEELDHEIQNLKDQIAQVENAPPPQGEMDDIEMNNEVQERIHALEGRLEEYLTKRDEILQLREEDSITSTNMIEQLIVRNEDDEKAYRAEIENLADELSKLDNKHAKSIEEINHERMDFKSGHAASMRNALSRISQLQKNMMNKQKLHTKQVQNMHLEIDRLRATLESFTTRQAHQSKEAAYAAKCYGEERRKFVAFHRELEMLNTELVRESVEHETLMKELTKMDAQVLSELSAVGSRTSSVTYSRHSRF